MSHAALTAKYRPQTFAQVAGQDTITSILSRASLEGRVAPAYLFSGTRGVGKTTVARVFAKALNCRAAPVAEPCNVCDQCRAVTAGSSVDVVEIDGASNRGIDDVRRLKEVVGYAPMEGGYKIFIIDEAHMLSREAFNALLKTLEEPPARVTFILATTEPHKFPATIISRCQQYVFKSLSENKLGEHLADVLKREEIAFEDSALRLIARRGAGSVRDSMSLLGQVLALGEGKLTEKSAREVLGLAGQDAFIKLLGGFKNGDCPSICATLRELLDQGLDIGFFLRELASFWRTLFILRQSGEAALPVVDLPENEAGVCLKLAADFSLPHIHACWHMTLEGQRRVLTSLEPALALELLLLNLAMLPQLLSLESLSALGRKKTPPASGGGMGKAKTGGASPGKQGEPDPGISSARSLPEASPEREEMEGGAEQTDSPTGQSAARHVAVSALSAATVLPDGDQEKPHLSSHEAGKPSTREYESRQEPETEARDGDVGDAQPDVEDRGAAVALEEGGEACPRKGSLPEWDAVFASCAAKAAPSWMNALLHRITARWQGEELTLEAQDDFTIDQLSTPQRRAVLEPILAHWCGALPPYRIIGPEKKPKSREELRENILGHPLVKEMEERFGARVLDFGQMR